MEGLHSYDEVKVVNNFNHMMESVRTQTEGKPEAHFAFKTTCLISTDIMTRLSRSQEIYMKEILKFNKQEFIQIADLKASLADRGISASDEEIQAHFNSLKFADNTSDRVSKLEIFANAHLFRVRPELRTNLH